MEFWSEEFEEKLIQLWKKHACLYDISTKAFSDRVEKAAALENIYQEMNVAGWYITHHNAALGTKIRLTCFALIGCIRCSTGSVALPIVGDSWVASVRVSIAMQLNSTSSWVELRRYKRALMPYKWLQPTGWPKNIGYFAWHYRVAQESRPLCMTVIFCKNVKCENNGSNSPPLCW